MGSSDDTLRFGDYRVRALYRHERTPADVIAGREFGVVRVERDEVIEKFRSLVSAEAAARAMHERRPRKSPVQEFREDAASVAEGIWVLSSGCMLPWLVLVVVTFVLFTALGLLVRYWAYAGGGLLVIGILVLLSRSRRGS